MSNNEEKNINNTFLEVNNDVYTIEQIILNFFIKNLPSSIWFPKYKELLMNDRIFN